MLLLPVIFLLRCRLLVALQRHFGDLMISMHSHQFCSMSLRRLFIMPPCQNEKCKRLGMSPASLFRWCGTEGEAWRLLIHHYCSNNADVLWSGGALHNDKDNLFFEMEQKKKRKRVRKSYIWKPKPNQNNFTPRWQKTRLKSPTIAWNIRNKTNFQNHCNSSQWHQFGETRGVVKFDKRSDLRVLIHDNAAAFSENLCSQAGGLTQ